MQEGVGGRPDSIPTEPEPVDERRQTRARLGRRLFVVFLAVFLVLGALNVYGVRIRTASASGAGYDLSVTYAGVARPGLAVTWSLEIRRPGGFSDDVTVAVTSSYFDAYDENGFSPTPAEETTDGEWTIWRFTPPLGDSLEVGLDARIEPGIQATRVRGRVEVRTGPGRTAAVGVDFSTLVMP